MAQVHDKHNWRNNFDQIVHWMKAASLLCAMEPDHYKAMLTRKAFRITDAKVRASVCEYSAFYGELLDCISHGIEYVNGMHTTPKECALSPVDLTPYRSAWTKHVTGERQSLQELKNILDTMTSSANEKLAVLLAEKSGDYSSYSDYSETETDSDLDEDDDEYVEDEKPKQRSTAKDDSRDDRRSKKKSDALREKP